MSSKSPPSGNWTLTKAFNLKKNDAHNYFSIVIDFLFFLLHLLPSNPYFMMLCFVFFNPVYLRRLDSTFDFLSNVTFFSQSHLIGQETTNEILS